MTTAEKYVTAAYCAVFAIVLVYVVIIALKLQRLEREVDELERRVRRGGRGRARDGQGWLSFSSGLRCSCYGEAAVGYLGDARRPGAAGRAATWGVRLGWLAQTALLAVQATRDDGFPWGTWAGSLNLFVWLVVGRVPDLGLPAAVPAARARRSCRSRRSLLVVARAGGGTGTGARSQYSNLFLVAPRRPRARRVRRLHARGRAVRRSTSGRSGG